MTEIRCKKCHRLLFKLKEFKTCFVFEIKCPKCGYINTEHYFDKPITGISI
jgi:phage FluMu protein Com